MSHKDVNEYEDQSAPYIVHQWGDQRLHNL